MERSKVGNLRSGEALLMHLVSWVGPPGLLKNIKG